MALRVKVTEAMRSQLTVFLPSSSSITSSSKLTNDSTDDSDVIGNNNDTISPPPSNEIPESIAILNNSSTQQSSPLSNEEIKKLLSELEKGYLSVSTIKILTTKCGIQCSTLLKGSILTSSQAVEETQTTVPANNALIKRRQYLLAKQQEREYNQMTFGTDM